MLVVRILITFTALALGAAHTLVPGVTIDTASLALIAIALVPWLSDLLKKMELPGGVKIEFRDLEETAERAKLAGLVSESLTSDDEANYSFQLVATDDPALALAGLRIEVEKRLKEIAERNGIGTRRQGIGSLIRALQSQRVIGNQEYSAIADMIGTLNAAVHSEDIDERAADWAIDFGPKLLKALDERLETG